MPEIEISDQQQQQPVTTFDIARAWGERSSGRAPGRSAKRRQQQVHNLVRRMQAETRRTPDGRIEGPLRPCTVVNFNPVALVVEGQLRITVPKPGTTPHHQVKMPYRGRLVAGHYCYIASPIQGERRLDPVYDHEPIFYTTVTGHEVDSVLPIDVPTVEARVFSPHSIGCELWHQYNSPTHKLMGGILMFDQGPHVLKPENLERTDRRIWIPERIQIEEGALYSYTLREAVLEEELERIFEAQRNYCDVVIQKAHTLWAEQDVASRKMVTDTDREWARWAVSMGYLAQLPEWVNAKLVIGADMKELKVCRYCGAQAKPSSPDFCHSCHAPFDPFDAFMNKGLHVPEGYLMTLEGDELEAVLQKIDERRARFGGPFPSTPSVSPVDTRARRAAKGPKGKTADVASDEPAAEGE